MRETNDGFVIAEKDLELRGPGDVEGTRQSGMLNFKLASITNDRELLEAAKYYAEIILQSDEKLENPGNKTLRTFLEKQEGKTVWSKIS